MHHYDLIVIGIGSGNTVIDDSFADLDIALIEERKAGGTCVNYGCIPSKMLAYTAEITDAVASAGTFDIDADLRGLRWRDLRDRVFSRTDRIAGKGWEGREKADNITVYGGHAQFVGERKLTVTVDGTEHELSGDRIIVATGGRPIVPPLVEESDLPYETSDTIMRIDEPPRRLAVLGGGYIAAELAHVFAAAGAEITLIDKADRLLGGPQDDDVRDVFTQMMQKQHDVRLGRELEKLTGGPGELVLTLDDGSTVEADTLLVAIGRKPNGDRMNLPAAGIDTDDDGRIAVDEFCRTSADGVFALGDVSTPVPLKHVANREAEVVKHNLLNPDRLRSVNHDRVPSAVFANPEMASVGLTETGCREKHPDYRVGTRSYSDQAYGWAMQDENGFCKVLVDGATGSILGAHIIGPQAASLIQIFVVAMEFGIAADDLATRPYWIHPALTEVLENALLDASPKAAA